MRDTFKNKNVVHKGFQIKKNPIASQQILGKNLQGNACKIWWFTRFFLEGFQKRIQKRVHANVQKKC